MKPEKKNAFYSLWWNLRGRVLSLSFGALYAMIFSIYYFTMPEIRPENMLEVYRAVVDFNGVLFGFTGLIAVFSLEKVRTRYFTESGMRLLLVLTILLLSISTFLAFREMMLLPSIEFHGLPLVITMFTTSAAVLYSAVSVLVLSGSPRSK